MNTNLRETLTSIATILDANRDLNADLQRAYTIATDALQATVTPPGTKHNNNCLNKSEDDEPLFVLCGRDPGAADLVRRWAIYAAQHNVRAEKVQDAYEHAARMEHYARTHGKTPD